MKLNSENLNLNVRHLRALQAIAREGSFRAAAARLGVVPSALSELVRQLEESVGAPLFDRGTRPPALTPLAREFLAETAPLLDGMDRAISRLRQTAGLETGRLAIGASPSAISEIVAPLLTAFLAERPGISCFLHDDIAERLARMVSDGQLDMAIAGSALHSPDLVQEPMLRDPFGIACAAHHPFADRPAVTMDDLASQTMIGLSGETGIHQLLSAHTLDPALLHPRFVAHSTIAQLCMIRAGLGIGLLPRNAVCLFNDPRICFVPVDGLDLHRTLYLITPVRGPRSPAGAAFLELLRHRG